VSFVFGKYDVSVTANEDQACADKSRLS
jgi:hypothetical protein